MKSKQILAYSEARVCDKFQLYTVFIQGLMDFQKGFS